MNIPGNKLLIATHNKGKLHEFKLMLEPKGIEVLSADEAGLGDVEETGTTFEENALLKAHNGLKQTGLPTIGDDSGLVIAALGGEPGLHSARWAGPTKDFRIAMTKVEERMQDAADHSAYFICVLALALPEGEKPQFFEGRAHGQISFPIRGDDGFGYDPIFVPEGHDKTYAEIGQKIKSTISARHLAVEKFSKALAS